ncbi:hypothetical protein [Gemmatirosa kalamazoonensis]|uniref:hypothetical protein n=1 Tax=Gemmatirosa kalamazoonensis TaxID=861299 RepID=UPI00046D8156|nr:hypothetical protein [Gemmatirosa kalamazoonensis]
MRRSRRFVALALELLILHVAVLGGMGCAACAAEHGDRMPHAHAASTAHHGEHAPKDAPRHQHDGAPCAVADGCTVAAASAETSELAVTLTAGRTRIVVADEHLHRSARAAPEPPPPRA